MAEIARKTELAPQLLTKVSNGFLLGADPEFFVLDPPKHIPNQGAYAAHFSTNAGTVGSDHSDRVWELRPRESPSAYGVVTNIWKLLSSKQLSPVELFKWRSGAFSGTDTIGGHVHFGLQVLTDAQREALGQITKGLHKLDVLPSAEAKLRYSLHPEYEVGGWDTVRDCRGHAEYRSACSWLDKPGQALLCLTSFKLAAVDPESVVWPKSAKPKADLLTWLEWAAQKDVDAFMAHRLINRRGLEVCQADPDSDFKPMWRKEELWHSK